MTKATKKTPANATAPKSKAASKTSVADADTVDKLGKTGLVEQISTRTSLSKAEASTVVDAVLEAITSALRAGQTVGLPGLGTLSVKATAARQGVRPGTAEKIQIPAGRKVGYKVALDLKKSL